MIEKKTKSKPPKQRRGIELDVFELMTPFEAIRAIHTCHSEIISNSDLSKELKDMVILNGELFEKAMKMLLKINPSCEGCLKPAEL